MYTNVLYTKTPSMDVMRCTNIELGWAMSEYVSLPTLSQKGELLWDAKRIMAFQAAVAITVASISKDASHQHGDNTAIAERAAAMLSAMFKQAMILLEFGDVGRREKPLDPLHSTPSAKPE